METEISDVAPRKLVEVESLYVTSGQLHLYVKDFDRERLTAGGNPKLGLILCTDKNEAVVRYTLDEELKKQIFARRYKLHLPTKTKLKAEIKRELRILCVYDAGKVSGC